MWFLGVSVFFDIDKLYEIIILIRYLPILLFWICWVPETFFIAFPNNLKKTQRLLLISRWN